MKISVKRTLANDSAPIEYQINPKLCLAELKLLIQCDFDVEPEEQRLVYRGKVLKEPENTSLSVSDLGLMDGAAIYLAREARNSISDSSSVSKSGKSPNASTLKEAMAAQEASDPYASALSNNPMTEFLLNNPELFKSLMLADPHMKKMLDQNPEINAILNNPSVLRDMIKMQLDPKHRKEATRSNDLAMRNLETIPQAYQEMQKLYHKLEEPYQNMQAEQADSFNATLRSSSNHPSNIQKLTSEPLPNPWASPTSSNGGSATPKNTGLSRINMPFAGVNSSNSSNTFNELQNGFKAFYNGSNGNQITPSSSSPSSSFYQNQLNRMSEMGFTDASKNIEALTACNGDLDLAITYLVEHGLIDPNDNDSDPKE